MRLYLKESISKIACISKPSINIYQQPCCSYLPFTIFFPEFILRSYRFITSWIERKRNPVLRIDIRDMALLYAFFPLLIVMTILIAMLIVIVMLYTFCPILIIVMLLMAILWLWCAFECYRIIDSVRMQGQLNASSPGFL